MKETSRAVYLGDTLTTDSNAIAEIRARIAATIPVVGETAHSNGNLVHNRAVATKLVYGFETLQYTDAAGSQLDMFQQRGLRKVDGIPSSCIDRM